jgi:cyanophycin synthetase
MIAHIFKGIGKKVGMTSTDGVVVDERLLIRSDASGPRSARMVLQNPRVDFAVFEVARGGILREGLGYERNDVGVVLNVQPDHLGLRGVDTLEQLADVKAVIVEAVPRNGFAVLNADDPLVRAMRRRCAGRIVWFTMAEPSSEIRDAVDDHCRRGGLAVVLEHSDLGDMIVVKEGRRAMQLAWTHLLPATFGGRATMNVQNAMAAAAAAFAAGASLHDIRQGLRTFSTNYYLSPGRLNEVSVAGRTVIVDYCHNVPGMIMLGDFVDKTGDALEATNDLGRISRIGVIATAGDRRNDDMHELGHEAARHFDVLIVREDSNLRARPSGEVANLIAGGARQAMTGGARCKQVEIVLDELASVRHAMSRSNTGDLVVICVEQPAAVMAELESLAHHAQPGARREDDRELSNAVPDPDFAPDATHDEPVPQATRDLA